MKEILMKTITSTSVLALLFAAVPAVAQSTTGQMPVPAQPSRSSDMATAPGTLPQDSTVTSPTGQTVVDQTNTNRNTVGTQTQSTTSDQTNVDRNTMGTQTQSTAVDQTTTTAAGASDRPTSPDGSPAFGIEPYFGILGGYDSYDRSTDINGNRGRRLDGAQIEGVIGVNIPLGAAFVGVEGHGARGFGDIRWEYGVRGRGGFRMGDSGLIYASAGYTWTNVLNRNGFDDRKSWVWGLGIEAGPRDIWLGGVTSRSGPRFRLSVETADFNSIRPMAGVIFHF
jgi:opacity protein-like surface antigen